MRILLALCVFCVPMSTLCFAETGTGEIFLQQPENIEAAFGEQEMDPETMSLPTPAYLAERPEMLAADYSPVPVSSSMMQSQSMPIADPVMPAPVAVAPLAVPPFESAPVEAAPVPSITQEQAVPRIEYLSMIPVQETAVEPPIESPSDAALVEGIGEMPEPAPAPFSLPQPQVLQSLGFKMFGWVQGGFTANGYGSSNKTNGYVATNEQANEFMLNQLWLGFERVADNGGCGTAWGGRLDMSYGTDWRYGNSYGLEDRINGNATYNTPPLNNQLLGLIIPQIYGEFAYNDLKVKAGRWASCYSHEIVPAPANFFYSHALSMPMEPLLTTGVTADYKINDCWTATAGAQNGWLTFENPNGKWNMIGGLRYTPTESTTIRYNFVSGKEDPTGQYNKFGQYLVWDQKLTGKVDYTLQYSMTYDNNGSSKGQGMGGMYNGIPTFHTPTNGDAQMHSIGNWLTYQYCDTTALGVRMEWVSAPDGYLADAVYGSGDFYELTLGANWRPAANAVIRPEIRWDWAGKKNTGGMAFNNGTRRSQCVVACDFILMF